MIKKNAALLTLQQTNWAKALASQSQEEQLDQEERTYLLVDAIPVHTLLSRAPLDQLVHLSKQHWVQKQAIPFTDKISMSKRPILHSMKTFPSRRDDEGLR